MTDAHPAVLAVAKAKTARRQPWLSWEQNNAKMQQHYIDEALLDIRIFLDATRKATPTMISWNVHWAAESEIPKIRAYEWQTMHDQLRREVLGDE